jgi:hypothetical protein
MLDAAIGPEWGFRYNTLAAPVAVGSRIGISVTPGVSNAEGAWTQIAAAANITTDIFGIWISINAGATSATAKNHLLDIGVDPAGGTSYVAVISNIVCGMSGFYDTARDGSRNFYFPICISSGSSVAVRIQGNVGTAGTVGILASFYGAPNRPELARAGQYSETIGTITNSNGVAFTPGTSGAEGSWTSLGTTTRDLWWWQLCVQEDASSIGSGMWMMDLAYGDASNKVLIIENLIHLVDTTEQVGNQLCMHGYKRVPGGSTLYVRGSISGTTTTGFNAVAVGVGG